MADAARGAALDDFKKRLAGSAVEVTTLLSDLMPPEGGLESRLAEAMGYATVGGGKRIRPFLVVASAELFNVPRAGALRVAAALEMVHCYSLVHDDLPAMDDDDMRRGRPSCHKKYDEATAILVGDALLTLAFEVLGHEDTHQSATIRAELVLELARAAGAQGMVGGQMLDLEAENHNLDIAEITRLQHLKTGMLITFASEAGAILGKAGASARHALRNYARDLGLAFQIADDLLDAEGDEKVVGKKTGKDAAAGKATFVSLMGADRARSQAGILAEQAARHLDIFGPKADPLKDLAKYVVTRQA